MAAPRGVPKIEVTFDVDANGILSVTAKDTATGKDQKITITASSGLSEAEIQKMVKDAADHEADDKVRRGQVERRNKLDNLCHSLDKTLRENADKVDAADVAVLSALIKRRARRSREGGRYPRHELEREARKRVPSGCHGDPREGGGGWRRAAGSGGSRREGEQSEPEGHSGRRV
jgi:molecular chaperone DnaK